MNNNKVIERIKERIKEWEKRDDKYMIYNPYPNFSVKRMMLQELNTLIKPKEAKMNNKEPIKTDKIRYNSKKCKCGNIIKYWGIEPKVCPICAYKI